MPVPYSDNLYSALDDDEDVDDYAQTSEQQAASSASHPVDESRAGNASQHDDDEALSPSDGYFHASDAVAYEQPAHRQSANVPNVPNVLVEDPTLRDGDRDTKTREAEHERRLSTMAALQLQDSQSNSQQSPSASASGPRHSHRRSVEEDGDIQDHIYGDSAQSARSPPLAQSHQQPESRPSQASPLFQQQHFDAPPAYTPSPTVPSQPSNTDYTPSSPTSNSDSSTGYQTFGSPPTTAGASMGNPSETQRLLSSNREPESMGGNTGDQEPRTFAQRFKRAFTITDGRRKLTRVLKWLVITCIVLGLLSGLSFSGKHHPSDKIGKPEDPPASGEPQPVPEPHPNPETPNEPHKPSEPPSKNPDEEHSDLRWKPRKYCRQPDRDFRILASWGAEFGSSQSISIVQRMSKKLEDVPSARQPNIEGEVILRRASSSDPRGSIKVEVMTNAQEEETDVHFEREGQELTVTTPNKLEWHYAAGPCIQMRVTVSAPAGSALERLVVNTTQLDIDILSGLDLSVDEEVLLRAISGDINAPKHKTSFDTATENDDPYVISNRRTVVETVSGNIKGWFALNDLLKVTSVSGDIAVDIAPQVVDSDNPARAELCMSTASGDILALEPINKAFAGGIDTSSRKFPGRDYYVDIATSSGKIEADVAVSSYSNIRSQSGNLILTMWPVLDPSDKAQVQISTNTKSGDQRLTVLEPLWTGIIKPEDQRLAKPGKDDKDKPKDDEPWLIIHPHDQITSESTDEVTPTGSDKRALGNVLSRHGTISGDIRLHYPSAWEGSLIAETMTGTQRIRGEGLDVYDIGTPLMKTYSGRKGNGASNMKIVTISGDENVLIGKEP